MPIMYKMCAPEYLTWAQQVFNAATNGGKSSVFFFLRIQTIDSVIFNRVL